MTIECKECSCEYISQPSRCTCGSYLFVSVEEIPNGYNFGVNSSDCFNGSDNLRDLEGLNFKSS